jgi:hypothetical protein
MQPSSLPASTGVLPVNASQPRVALPLLQPTTVFDASSTSPAVSRDPNAHLPPNFPTMPCPSVSTLPHPSVPPAIPMPPDVLLSTSESHPHLNPLSVPLHPVYTEPDSCYATSLPMTTRQIDTRQICMAAHTLVMNRPGSTFLRDASVWIQTHLSGTGLS